MHLQLPCRQTLRQEATSSVRLSRVGRNSELRPDDMDRAGLLFFQPGRGVLKSLGLTRRFAVHPCGGAIGRGGREASSTQPASCFHTALPAPTSQLPGGEGAGVAHEKPAKKSDRHAGEMGWALHFHQPRRLSPPGLGIVSLARMEGWGLETRGCEDCKNLPGVNAMHWNKDGPMSRGLQRG